MAVKKPKQLTKEYLSELRAESETLGSALGIAKKELYKLAPTAKLGNPLFESWRRKCTELTRDFLKLQDEIERTEKVLNVE